MKKYLILPILAILFNIFDIFAQNSLKAIIKDAENQEILIGVNALIKGTNNGTSSDLEGLILLKNISNGQQIIVFSFIGYKTLEKIINFPTDEILTISLESAAEELEDVIITSTRSTRTIAEIPTRIEAIAGEELEEKGNMNSGNISMLLKESTGIQVQQTSATSANMNFRIQGLDGRYTQLLQNGLPLYSGFSSGLSIMQIPPLDLKQVEIIKGSASTLYGGGAIAGLINLISKEPTEKREISLQAVGHSSKGADFNGFYSQKIGKLGITLFASYHFQEPFDPNQDQFSDIPKQRRFNFNPRLFYYFSEKTSLSFGVNSSFENREGGFIPKIAGDSSPLSNYTESNISQRLATQFKFDHQFGQCSHFFIKNSVNIFDRKITVPDYQFEGKQLGSFSEIGYAKHGKKAEWVTGLNLWTDEFREKQDLPNQMLRDYSLLTFGVFLQNVWNINSKITLETGLRTDYQSEYGAFVLPRISALYKWNDKLTMRLGGGLGYKSPSIFTQESEQVTFKNVLPINKGSLQAESSQGLNFDLNYKTVLFQKLSFSLNQLFFYTKLNNTLVLNANKFSQGIYSFENANGHTDAQGSETNLKLIFNDFKLFAFYSFIDTKRHYNALNNQIPLTARHRIGAILMYEIEDKWRIGYEMYYTGRQELSDGELGRDYTTMGFLVERIFKLNENQKFSIYFNAENFMDIRLSRWQAMYSGTVQKPKFTTDIYAPTDGRIISLGIKLKL